MFGHEIAHVNYAIVFCFIVVRAPVPQRAVQALVVVVSLDIFEDFSTSFDLGGEDAPTPAEVNGIDPTLYPESQTSTRKAQNQSPKSGEQTRGIKQKTNIYEKEGPER